MEIPVLHGLGKASGIEEPQTKSPEISDLGEVRNFAFS